ncbi:16977_t:CDS:2, partial [Dentiscutata erythropus]
MTVGIKSIKAAPFISTFSGHKINNVGSIQRITFLKERQLVYSTKANGEKQEKNESKVSKTEIYDNQLKKNTSLYQTPPLINTELIYVFVDNSNVFIEGKYAISKLENLGTFDNKRHSLCFNQFHIDHGKLLATIQDNRKLGDAPVFVGSRPSPNDSLWRNVREQGCNVMVYDRNIENRVKKVDVALAHAIDKVIFTKSPGILALVSGNSDYDPIVTTALKCNWIVETWFWNMGMSGELKDKTIFTPLDYHYKSFSCGFGPDFEKNNQVLEVIGHNLQNWGNKEMINIFAPLNVF